jgi:hypothetical protein
LASWTSLSAGAVDKSFQAAWSAVFDANSFLSRALTSQITRAENDGAFQSAIWRSGDFGSPGKGAHRQSQIVAFQPRSPTIIANSKKQTSNFRGAERGRTDSAARILQHKPESAHSGV